MERLFEVSQTGDVNSLRELLNSNPYLLHSASTGFCETPLHIAVMYGHVMYAEEILGNNPELASELDSQGFTPLHLASAKTNLHMVELLLRYNPGICTVLDQEGRTPLHIATMKSRVDIMRVLIQTEPSAIHVLMDRRETILHLCVKLNRLEGLKVLVEYLVAARISTQESDVSINSKDEDGNTILHLAIARRQTKMVKYLLQCNVGVKMDAINKNGVMPLDMLAESLRDDLEIGDDHLRDAGAYDLRTNEKQQQEAVVIDANQSSHVKSNNEQNDKHLEENRNFLFLVAALIATIAFTAVMSPPGGVFQEDSKVSSKDNIGLFIRYLSLVNPKALVKPEALDLMLKVPYFRLDVNFTTFLKTSSAERSLGIVMDEDRWNITLANQNSSSYPYLVRYAGTPIFAYLHPKFYAAYVSLNMIAFLTCLTIIFSPLEEFASINLNLLPLKPLKKMLSLAVLCVFVGFLLAIVSMSPPAGDIVEFPSPYIISFLVSIFVIPIICSDQFSRFLRELWK